MPRYLPGSLVVSILWAFKPAASQIPPIRSFVSWDTFSHRKKWGLIPQLTKAYFINHSPLYSAFQSEQIATHNSVLKETCTLPVSDVRGTTSIGPAVLSALGGTTPVAAGNRSTVLKARSNQGLPHGKQQEDLAPWSLSITEDIFKHSHHPEILAGIWRWTVLRSTVKKIRCPFIFSLSLSSQAFFMQQTVNSLWRAAWTRGDVHREGWKGRWPGKGLLICRHLRSPMNAVNYSTSLNLSEGSCLIFLKFYPVNSY